jgi:hypothetical protein
MPTGATRKATAKKGPPDRLRFSVSEALADPIVRALMAADRISPESVAALMQRMAALLASRAPSNGSH